MKATEYNFEIITKAVTFAGEKHAGMIRKGSDCIPYIVHPLEAAAIVATMTNDPDMIAAAALHDVVEDSVVTVEEIYEKFNANVARLVEHESEDKREDQPAEATWFIRKQEAVARLKEAPLDAKMVALGDKLSNIRAIKRDFAKKGTEMWEPFNQKDHDKQGAYCKALIWAMSELKEYDAWQEYRKLTEEVFGVCPAPEEIE